MECFFSPGIKERVGEGMFYFIMYKIYTATSRSHVNEGRMKGKTGIRENGTEE